MASSQSGNKGRTWTGEQRLVLGPEPLLLPKILLSFAFLCHSFASRARQCCHGTVICLAVGIPSPGVLCHLGGQAWPVSGAGSHLGHMRAPGYTQGRDVQGEESQT